MFPNNSVEQNPSWVANGHSASQEILCLLGNLKVIAAFTGAWMFTNGCHRLKMHEFWLTQQ